MAMRNEMLCFFQTSDDDGYPSTVALVSALKFISLHNFTYLLSIILLPVYIGCRDISLMGREWDARTMHPLTDLAEMITVCVWTHKRKREGGRK